MAEMPGKRTHKCGAELKTEMRFCPSCGEQVFKAVRSVNEIQAHKIIIEKHLDKIVRKGDMVQATLVGLQITCFEVALDWVVGHHFSPLRMLEQYEEKQRRKQ